MAERVFLSKGFGNATMKDVADEARASKETLYRHFGSKEDLFAEIVSKRARCLRGQLDTAIDSPRSVHEVLHDLGTHLLEAMTSPEVVTLLRMVAQETPRDPALGRLFYSVGPGQTLGKLAEFLSMAQARQEFGSVDPAMAAGIFVGAIMSQTHMQCLLLRDVPRPSAHEVKARVDEVVAMFTGRYVKPDTASPGPAGAADKHPIAAPP